MQRRKLILLTGILAFGLSVAYAVNTMSYVTASSKGQLSGKKAEVATTVQAGEGTGATRPTRQLPDPASLSGKKICWGQGRNYDALNRPRDAVTSQQKYGGLGGLFIDLSDSDADALTDPAKKKICLTFDEGYENGYTGSILDTLRDKKVQAVFFITGDYARREGELVRRMIDEGIS